jgi:hypothetical protein
MGKFMRSAGLDLAEMIAVWFFVFLITICKVPILWAAGLWTLFNVLAFIYHIVRAVMAGETNDDI